jgi:hypothetical protein
LGLDEMACEAAAVPFGDLVLGQRCKESRQASFPYPIAR